MRNSLLIIMAALTALILIAGCVAAPETAGQDAPVKDVVTEDETAVAPDSDDKAAIPPAPEEKEEAVREKRIEDEAELSFALEVAPAGSAAIGGEARISARPVERPSESGLSAGYADDNQQYGYFLTFLNEYSEARHLELDVSERLIFEVKDADGRPVPNASVRVEAETGEVVVGTTASDGTLLFFPRAYGDLDSAQFRVSIDSTAGNRELTVQRAGVRRVEIKLERPRIIPDPPPVDILFVLDTTGSMGEEIERLKTTIELIHMNLTAIPAAPAIRFGLVLYKDIGDSYRTRLTPLTGDLKAFQAELAPVTAGGGGDTPEDLQAALNEGVEQMAWNGEGVRLIFVITDAPPQLDYGDTPAYTATARRALEKGIRIYSVGTGGLPLDGEYVLRQIAQYTGGRYIFLTYGETGESGGGAPGSVSHHTGANFQTDKLESIIIRFAKEEIANLTDRSLEQPESYFEATKIDAEEREETLANLFGQAVEQLADFSSLGFDGGYPVAVLPLSPGADEAPLQAEYFSERLILAAAESERFTLVERRNLQSLMDELELQLSGLTDGEGVTELGRLLNARAVIGGSLFSSGEGYEIFLKLMRVETGEVLSVTRARIDGRLGL